MGEKSLRLGASAEQRVMVAIWRWWRDHGASPSYGDIERETGIAQRCLRPILLRLVEKGLILWLPRRARSIRPIDRGAELADVEIELIVQRRGGRVSWDNPTAPAAAYVPVMDMDCEVSLDLLIAQIDHVDGRLHGEDGIRAGDRSG